VDDKDTEYQLKLAAREVQKTPKSDEVHILPPSTTAVWYCPVLDNDTDHHFLLPEVVRAVQLTPKSDDV
jgi:hypothetical protein